MLKIVKKNVKKVIIFGARSLLQFICNVLTKSISKKFGPESQNRTGLKGHQDEEFDINAQMLMLRRFWNPFLTMSQLLPRKLDIFQPGRVSWAYQNLVVNP